MKPEFDLLGNIKNLDVPSYNVITEKDSISTVCAKQEQQYRQWLEVNEDEDSGGMVQEC